MRVELLRDDGRRHAARAAARRSSASSGRFSSSAATLRGTGRAAPAAAGAAPMAAPAPDAAPERMLALWATPIGFVKAAMANNATTRRTAARPTFPFTVGGKYKMEGTINAAGTGREGPHVVRPADRRRHVFVETTYSGYKDFSGRQLPSSHGPDAGWLSRSTTSRFQRVTVNPAVDIEVPQNVRNFQPPPVRVTSQKLADGVYYLTGGTHHSLAIEMADHIVVVDTPNNAGARARRVLAKAKELIPNKPIRFVVTSHHHWDHLGGIRAAMDEGATIVTHQSNKAFLERVAKTPHTIAPDRLASSKKAVKIQTVGDDGRLTRWQARRSSCIGCRATTTRAT